MSTLRIVTLPAAIIVASLLVPNAVSAQSATPNDSRSAADGAYTTAQADKGKAVFTNTCGNCHGTAEFSSASFRNTWTGQTAYTLFDQLRNTMPLDNPGGLSRDDYAAVIAYIMQLNRYPAGTVELPASDSALRRIRF